MERYVMELLAAERRGRALVKRFQPGAGDRWQAEIDGGEAATALMAACRWAARLGAEASIRINPEADDSRAWRELAESSRRQGLIRTGSATGNGLRLSGQGREIVLRPDDLPDADAAWHGTLKKATRFVDPTGPESPRMSCAECRNVDRVAIERFGVPGLSLMENAAVAAVLAAKDMISTTDAPIAILVGGGNNGGDGLAMARGFAALGIRTNVALLKPAGGIAGDAGANLDLLRDVPLATLHEIHDRPEVLSVLLPDAALIVDGLLGTGFKGGLSAVFKTAIDLANASGVPILALDLPSGLDGDSGKVGETAIRARRTVTFAAVKNGLLSANGPEYAGQLYLADIGAPSEALG